MDLSFKPEHAAFRQEVRDFLDEELTDELREAGKLTASVFSEVEYSSKWHKILYKKGWIGSRWPKEYGGTGWDDMQRYIFSSECASAGAPSPTSNGTTYGWSCFNEVWNSGAKRLLPTKDFIW